MRQLHYKTMQIVAYRDDLPKTILSHAWGEVFKFLASKQNHPKVFVIDMKELGKYLGVVYIFGKKKDCKLDKSLVDKLPADLIKGFNLAIKWQSDPFIEYMLEPHFDDNYLFSDAVSLYFKGHNIFPDIFGDQWRKYVPVESYDEITRQLSKHTNCFTKDDLKEAYSADPFKVKSFTYWFKNIFKKTPKK